jgi:hypothetical protein
MIEDAGLIDRLPRLAEHGEPFRGQLVRALHPRHWEDPFGLGREKMPAGRLNPAGGARVLYLGDDFYTCAEEAQIFLVPEQPIAFLTVEVDLRRVLDLRRVDVQALLETREEELAARFEHDAPGLTPLQRLGEALAVSGRFDAVQFVSAQRPGHHCTAVFTDALGEASRLRVVDKLTGKVLTWPR